MKLLLDAHMLNLNQTGNERYWKNLILNLNNIDKKIKIVLYTNLHKNKLPKKFQKFDVYTPKFSNGFYRIIHGLNDAIKKFKPDLIHVQNFAPLKKTVPIVNTVHDLCFKICPNTFSLKSKLAFKLFFKRSLDLSDAIICVSEFTKKMLLKYYKVNPKKIFVIYEAADSNFYYLPNKKEVGGFLKKRFKIASDYLLVVGTDKRKLPIAIIEVFKEIIKKIPHLQLIITGPRTREIKDEKNIKFLYYVSDRELNYLYNGAVSLIYLSLCEGFGLPLVEAMATRTPIICSKIPVFEEIGGGCALFIKNKQELYQAILKIYQGKNLQKKYSHLSYKKSHFFSWEKTAKETLKIYKNVLKKSF